MAGDKKTNGMVTLKPIGVTEDGAYVTLARRANAKSGGWRIAVDDDLLSRLEEAVSRARAARGIVTPVEPPPPPPARLDSKLSPKEIQALLREGRSVGAIAKKAGVPAAWVERFEGPIVWERVGMATRARSSTLERSRRGPSALPLGESVETNLRRRGARLDPAETEDAWDAVRHPRSDRWIVTFRYHYRNRDLTAQWEFDPETQRLSSINPLASQLGWVEPRSRRKAGTGD